MRTRWTGFCVLAAGFAVLAGPARAADLRIGLAAEPSTLDPHFHNMAPNNAMTRNLFDALVEQDERKQIGPGLATAWRTVDPTTWEFKLRPNVKFHNGAPFTAQDVVFSLCRVPQVPNSPSPFTVSMKAVAGVEAVDPLTVRVRTAKPYPLMAIDLSSVRIVSASTGKVTGPIVFKKSGCEGIAAYPTTEEFNSGKAAIGTGPFKFKQFVKGDEVVLARNDAYWGRKPAWETVTFKPIPSDGPRVAALLAGDVDMIENPPSQDLPKLRKNPKVTVVDTLSSRVIYIELDVQPGPTKGVKVADRNPLHDPRVRQALSIAIDRKAIDTRIMGGQAEPASQILTTGLFGSDPDLKVAPFDPKKARELLAAAGYAKGFELTLTTPNDRYMNDEKIAQAIAQYWTRIGVKTTVDAMTKSVFFSRRAKKEFSVALSGWGTNTGEASSPLKAMVACVNRELGYGTNNYINYCNEKLDAALTEALSTIDDAKRGALYRRAMDIAIGDAAVIPIHYEKTPWALRQGLTYKARMDQYTLAAEVTPVK